MSPGSPDTLGESRGFFAFTRRKVWYASLVPTTAQRGKNMRAPSICQGNNTCDSRIPHICYNGTEPQESPWEAPRS